MICLSFLSIMLIAVLGCQTTHSVAVNRDGQPQFDQMTIVYEVVEPTIAAVNGEPVELAYAKTHPLKAALASRESMAIPDTSQPDLRLTIRSPHPDGPRDTALVTLAAPALDRDAWHTVATRTLPRRDLDLLLVHLANGGVFDSETRPLSTTRLSIDIDGHRTEKPWNREPRLDRMAIETYDAR